MKIKKRTQPIKMHNKRDSEITLFKKGLNPQNVYIKLKGKLRINSILVRIKAPGATKYFSLKWRKHMSALLKKEVPPFSFSSNEVA